MSLNATCDGFASNPDISGIGVRISFYLQTFFLVLLVDRSWEDAPISLWTFVATSFGLMIGAIVQREQLSFFQALQVSNLVWLANFGTFVALASFSRQKAASHRDHHGSDYKVKFGAMTQTLLSMALTIYIWSNAETFGNQRTCSPLIKYVLFVIKVPALGTGRTVGLAVSSVLTVAYIGITLHELRSYFRKQPPKHEKAGSSEQLPMHVSSPRSMTFASIPPSPKSNHPRPLPSALVIPASPSNSEHNLSDASAKPARSPHKRRPKRRRWSSDLDPMLIGIIICQIMVFTYFIVSTELLLRYNKAADNSAKQMTFGQILALVVTIPSALSVTGALNEHGLKRLSKRKKKELGARRAKRKPTVDLGSDDV